LGFLLGGVTLGVRLILLGLALADYVVTAGHGAHRFLRLALDVLDDALDGFFGSTAAHGFPFWSGSWCAYPAKGDPERLVTPNKSSSV